MTFRILVTGSRRWPLDRAFVITAALRTALDDATSPPQLVVGDCPTGVDRIATYSWQHDDAVIIAAGQDRVRAPEVHRALWRDEGKAAGPRRNQRMVDAGADVCLAFPIEGSRGTWDCVDRARAAGIPTYVWSLEG